LWEFSSEIGGEESEVVLDCMNEVRISKHSGGMVGGKEVAVMCVVCVCSLSIASDKRASARLRPERFCKREVFIEEGSGESVDSGCSTTEPTNLLISCDTHDVIRIHNSVFDASLVMSSLGWSGSGGPTSSGVEEEDGCQFIDA
jgi:hypothetical protein